MVLPKKPDGKNAPLRKRNNEMGVLSSSVTSVSSAFFIFGIVFFFASTYSDELRFFFEETFFNRNSIEVVDEYGDEYYEYNVDVSKNAVQYQCSSDPALENDNSLPLDYYETDFKKHRNNSNKFDYVNFMDQTYAGWGITPRNRQGFTNDRWIQWYANSLKSGDVIYESACGAGLTMYGILELLRRDYNITDLEVHGNDYMSEVIHTANRLYNREHKLGHVKKGVFCQGDSSNLPHVPSESFDLVFTGYIQPMDDPLNIGHNTAFLYCLLPLRNDLIEKEYKMQEDWIAKWVDEMLRIAKPGATIIIEGMASVRCENKWDWGGVRREWWKQTILSKTYGWDVDPDSVEIAEFNPTGEHQPFLQMTNMYNVKFTKNKA